MPLKLIETDLEDVPPELRKLYMKDTKSRNFKLALSDLESYVSARVAPIEHELKIAHENEHKLSLSAALREGGVNPRYEALAYANLRDRVQLKTVENKRVVRVLADDGATPMAGSGSNGLATLDDLVQEAIKCFPLAFGKGETPDRGPVGSKTVTLSEFDRLSAVERARRMSEGYTLVEVAAEAPIKAAVRSDEKVLSRAEFDRLRPKERAAKFADGFRMAD